VLHIKSDEQAAGHAYSEACDINKTVNLTPQEVAVSYLKKMFQHD
jgi:hypothetical protein